MITLITTKFRASHWREPNPNDYGVWWFESADGEVVSHTGTLIDATTKLDASRTWFVLP